jgi:hypothetical protein
MKRFPVLLTVLFVLAAIFMVGVPAFASNPVVGEFPPAEGTHWSDPLDLGDGQVQVFVTLDESDNPLTIGVYFTESALSNLPEELTDGKSSILDADGNVFIPCCGHEFILDVPETDSNLTFEIVGVNWNPVGHPPAGLYEPPHFDLHFYTITDEERLAIEPATAETMCSVPNPPDVGGESLVPVTCETFEEATMPLPDEQMPPGYFNAGAVEPAMGNHLINGAAPEIAEGAPFTHTWIYGTYAGKITFFEPMITLAYLEQLENDVCVDISMPAEMPEPGYYPTQYCMRHLSGDDNGEGAYVVTLEGLIEY